jgi:hypothetical protein
MSKEKGNSGAHQYNDVTYLHTDIKPMSNVRCTLFDKEWELTIHQLFQANIVSLHFDSQVRYQLQACKEFLA